MINRNFFRVLTLAALLTGAFATEASACTNIIVSKGASRDGSCMVSYAADSHWLFGELYYRPAATYEAGSMLKVYDWDSNRYIGDIEQVGHTYKTVGNMNEHQLIIGETTWGGRPELEDKRGGIDYGSLIYITLQRAKTAREAIQVMTDLVAKYGYASEGETFSIADPEEAWILEMIGKGMNIKNGVNIMKGAVWVARRVPDGYICAHANQARIGKFPLDDPENCLYSKDVISFARRKGYFSGEDEDFSFKKAYCPVDFGTVRGCDARVWSAYNILSNGWFTFVDGETLVTRDAYTFIDYAMGYDLEGDLPLFIRPQKRLTVKDIADVMRDHYEGTPMDMTVDIGAGGNGLPYRWRPMEFSVDGKTYVNERAIATQQTGFWFVGQARSYYPDEIGGILWFGTDDAATSYLTPIYTSTDKVPECFREGNGDMLHYSATSSFWMNNRVANACYKMYDQMAPYVRKNIDAFENKMVSQMIPLTDNDAINL
ncbi:MAG: C69 family dipeptidase, partial [Bacteroidota bacterium]|nr:C69 family dipeptidase [Bacteroidota bacterium]